MIVKLSRFQFLGTASFFNSLEISQLWKRVTRKVFLNILQGGYPLEDDLLTSEAYQVLQSWQRRRANACPHI